MDGNAIALSFWIFVGLLLFVGLAMVIEAVLRRTARRDYRRFVQADRVAERKRAVTRAGFKSRMGVKS